MVGAWKIKPGVLRRLEAWLGKFQRDVSEPLKDLLGPFCNFWSARTEKSAAITEISFTKMKSLGIYSVRATTQNAVV